MYILNIVCKFVTTHDVPAQFWNFLCWLAWETAVCACGVGWGRSAVCLAPTAWISASATSTTKQVNECTCVRFPILRAPKARSTPLTSHQNCCATTPNHNKKCSSCVLLLRRLVVVQTGPRNRILVFMQMIQNCPLTANYPRMCLLLRWPDS